MCTNNTYFDGEIRKILKLLFESYGTCRSGTLLSRYALKANCHMGWLKFFLYFTENRVYCNNLKYLDRQACVNSLDPDQNCHRMWCGISVYTVCHSAHIWYPAIFRHTDRMSNGVVQILGKVRSKYVPIFGVNMVLFDLNEISSSVFRKIGKYHSIVVCLLLSAAWEK